MTFYTCFQRAPVDPLTKGVLLVCFFQRELRLIPFRTVGTFGGTNRLKLVVIFPNVQQKGHLFGEKGNKNVS